MQTIHEKRDYKKLDSGYANAQNEIDNLISAKYPFIHVTTENSIPVIKTIVEIADALDDDEEANKANYDVLTWNLHSGWFCERGTIDKGGHHSKNETPSTLEEKINSAYQYIKDYTKNAIFILEDFDAIISEQKLLSFGMKDLVQGISLPLGQKENILKRHKLASSKGTKHIVVVSSTQQIPRELEKLVNVVNFGMPGKREVAKIIDTIIEESPRIKVDDEDNLINAAMGLTEPELVNAIYKSICTSPDDLIRSKDISSLKEQIIKKGGFLEFTIPKVNINDIGGMANLMNWIERRKVAFNEQVRLSRKLPYPKGILLTGIPGCGKSHSVQVISSYLELPLLRLDVGSLMGPYVGQTDENTRKAIKLAESVAPCVLWIDEIEKAFPDPRNGNTHEVSKRLLSFFLTWMQEKKSSVFVIATANNVDMLPPELLRKGRFDEMFFVDLPTSKEREQIFRIFLKKVEAESEAKQIDLTEVLDKTEGYSGAEIEALVNEANFQSAYDNKPLDVQYLLQEIGRTKPMSVTREEAITAIRNWAKDKDARPAN